MLQSNPLLPHTNETEIWRAYGVALRPPPPMEPAEFAAKYRQLHPIYCSERPGPWNNEAFPYQRHVMNAGAEAIRTGRRGLVFMKAGQIGGTDAAINIQLWLKEYYPGPQLFMSSTEKVANEFGRERFGPIINDMEPLKKKYIPKKRGDILTKRFIDGKIQLSGGQSVFNLQSTPYRVVVIDELDSLVESLGGQGDPLKLAEVRTDSFSGQTLIIAYAHPSTKDRGAAKIYYQDSDQRRGFVRHDCGHEFYLQWDHVKATVAHDRMTLEQAKIDPDCYAYYCPGCGAQVSDSERVGMVRNVEYKTTLDSEEAKKKRWIGMHASQLYSPSKTIRSFACRWLECIDDENAKRVFYNKVLGEPFESTLKKSSAEDWRRLIVVPRRESDPEAYRKGQVPPGVRFLTAGQDSNSEEFHYAIWGYGLARTTSNTTVLRRWLIDWDTIKRKEKSNTITSDELTVFDQLIYNRYFPTTYSDLYFDVREGAHDTGWSPNAIYEYSRSFEWRAIPIKGGAESSLKSAPAWRESHKPKYRINDEEMELGQPLIIFNTYLLKFDMYNTLMKTLEIFEYGNSRKNSPTGKREIYQVALPMDVDDAFLEQSSSEFLTYGKRRGEKVWDHHSVNHYGDCNTYSYGLALKINPFQAGLAFDEAEQQAAEQEEAQRIRSEKQEQQKKDAWLSTDRYKSGNPWIARE